MVRYATTYALRAVWLLILGATLLFSYGGVSALPPFTEKDLDYVIRQQHFRDSEAELSCDPASPPQIVNRSVYMLGDSWLVRLASNPNIGKQFELLGFNVTGINGVTGRSITGQGQGQTGVEPQSGLEALDADAEKIKQVGSGAIVIILGTNNGQEYDDKIPEFMEKLKGINNAAKVFWVNTAATTLPDDSSAANEAIEEHSRSEEGNNYDVVNWFSAAFPGGDPTDVDGNAKSDFMDTDKLHPKIPEGTKLLSTMLTTRIASGSAQISLLPGSTTSSSGLGDDVILKTGNTQYVLKGNWRPIIERAASRFEIDPYILIGILRVETGWPNPDEVEAAQIRNSATATGPFQILDITLQDISDRVDGSYARKEPPTGRLIKQVGGTGSAVELDGSLILDGNKDGNVSRHNPWDAAMMAAALVKSLGGREGLAMGSETDPIGTANEEIKANTNTIKKVFAHYNQGGGWRSSMAVQGRNDVTSYMKHAGEAYDAAKAANWFSGGDSGNPTSSGCGGSPSTLSWPVISGDEAVGRVTSCWSDLRTKTVSGGSYYHSGIDIAAAEGTDVITVEAGTVVYVSDSHPVYGSLIILEHDTGFWSHYGHLSKIEENVTEGTQIGAKQKIGEVGNTGVSYGAHLHLNFYDRWPFGALPEGAASGNGNETINPLTHGLSVPAGVQDEADCQSWPNGGREVNIEL